uniref:Patched domain containing 3 n=1 Tax=Plectus sambesii TaxID=2011161 RepID=A0A914WZ42_9BILA
EFNQNLRPFLLADDNYGHDVLFGPNKTMGGEGDITVFRLSTKLKGVDSNNKIMTCTAAMRGAADAFPQFNLTTYTPMWNLADQFDIMLPQTLQNVIIDLVCMFIISLLLIPHPLCAVVVVLSIMSVHVGVLGLMTWWNVNLEATSMITLAVSVGFSVDFAAHITYAYTITAEGKNGRASPDERVIGALGDLGWPLVQGASATLLGVGVLGTINSYIVRIVFKTIMLVIVLGVVHALIFLPVAMSLVHQTIQYFNKCRRKGRTVQIANIKNVNNNLPQAVKQS